VRNQGAPTEAAFDPFGKDIVSPDRAASMS
jgi:hypothetical protein